MQKELLRERMQKTLLDNMRSMSIIAIDIKFRQILQR